jgi:hypothetical protein
MLRFVPALGAMMIALGCIELTIGGLVALATMMIVVIGIMQQVGIVPVQPGDPPGVVMACCGGTFYGLPTILMLVVGAIHIYAGIKHLHYSGRIVGWVAAILGIVTATTCGCAPLGMAVGVLGIIAYVDPAVKRALTLGDEGMAVDEILQTVEHFTVNSGASGLGRPRF